MQLLRAQYGLSVERPGQESLPIRHIIGIGMNYAAHAREQGKAPPERIVYFTKNLSALALDGDAIVVPKICQDREQVDFEAELAFVVDSPRVGRTGQSVPIRDVPKAEALNFVLGYTTANDVSARWWQKDGAGGQFCRGKSFDTFCPLGTRLVPPDSLGSSRDGSGLRILCRVNGQVMQDSTTSDMIFDVATIVSELSRGTTLLPGTLILTGTPQGVGMARTPPAYLKHNDVVEVEIERIGTLRNTVRFE
jgi:2-keto-4-pentenoate hydratase/2-oxohepta-3-ene-1,7-dioic acid hydratase in catechol pathway